MGLIDFVKDAGERFLGGIKGALPDTANKELTEQLTKTISGLGLSIQDLQVEVEGDLAKVSGTAQSQADREKVVLLVGNTQGIARVDDRMAVDTPEPPATFYTVKSGDSLSKIAKAHYGDPMKYTAIFEANRPMLKDPDKIYPGQNLRIPPLERV